MSDREPPQSENEQSPDPKPSAPSSLPAYVCEPVERQNSTRLRALADWAQRLADWKEQASERTLDEPPGPDAGEVIEEHTADGIDVDHDEIPAGATVYIYHYKVPCGPGCNGCPHGPYAWGKWRDGDTVRTVYLGKPT